MRKRLLSILAICCLGVILVGCGNETKLTDNSSNTNTSESTNDTKSVEDSKNDGEVENSKNDDEKTPIKSDKKDTEVSLSIYSADVNSLDLTKLGSLKVVENEYLKVKLDKLATELSKNAFDSLPIEVKKIETLNGKKIAVVNLEESIENKKITNPSEYNGANWAASKFQGSTGGSITTKSLIETFLQKDYKGNWIDGVRFTYNSKPIDFGHVYSLSEISYR